MFKFFYILFYEHTKIAKITKQSMDWYVGLSTEKLLLTVYDDFHSKWET